MDNYPPTPELDKVKSWKEHSQIIGEFLDWLYNESPYHIGEYSDVDWSESQRASISIEGLLAEYFGINLKKVSAEKDAIYEWMRTQNV